LPFKILVSPFVHFDPETRTTDIMMFNSRNLGALIVDEDPHVKSWEDGQYNIQHMSIEETRSLPTFLVFAAFENHSRKRLLDAALSRIFTGLEMTLSLAMLLP
jgi:hypothetical protein